MQSSVPSSHLHQHPHSYPDSPSISSTIDSISGTGSPPPPLGQEMIPMSGLSLSSGAQHAGITSQYNDAMLLSYFPSQRYSMVTSSSVRRNARSSPESSDFGSPQPPPMGQPTSNVQYMNVPAQAPSSQPQANGNIRSRLVFETIYFPPVLTFEQLSTYDSGRSSDGFIEIFSTLNLHTLFFSTWKDLSFWLRFWAIRLWNCSKLSLQF